MNTKKLKVQDLDNPKLMDRVRITDHGDGIVVGYDKVGEQKYVELLSGKTRWSARIEEVEKIYEDDKLLEMETDNMPTYE